MDWKNDDDLLAFAIAFALKQYRYKPPPRFDTDPDERDRYYGFVASSVRDHLKLSWTFAKKPPTQ